MTIWNGRARLLLSYPEWEGEAPAEPSLQVARQYRLRGSVALPERVLSE